jgi:hypothetical protein
LTADRTHGDGYDGILALCRAYASAPVDPQLCDAWREHVTPALLEGLITTLRRVRASWVECDRQRKHAVEDLAEMLEAYR